MEMPTHSAASKDHFRALVGARDDVVVKPMFGSLGAFANGHMFAGLFGERVGVKLGPDDHRALEALDDSGPFGPPSRPMAGWLALPPAMPDAVKAEWVERARAWVVTLPPKVPRPRQGRRTRAPRMEA